MGTGPVDLLFGGMEKLGPGSDADTLHVLQLLPRRRYDVVVDAGCGAGRQTRALAKALGTPVHAVDTHEPFLADLARYAREDGIAHLVKTHCMDMKDIPAKWPRIDLLWSEGAAYSIGFGNALATWASAVDPRGYLVASELCWLRKQVPEAARAFFAAGYPDMRPLEGNIALAQEAGYRVLETCVVPPAAWVEGYYEVLEPRALALARHPEAPVRDFAAETLKEIEVFKVSEGSYGYVFFVLQRT